jgi:hypothetical protein
MSGSDNSGIPVAVSGRNAAFNFIIYAAEQSLVMLV